MIIVVTLFYLLLAVIFFKEWLHFFAEDQEISPQERWVSRMILVIATIVWPIVVPFAYLELLKFHKRHKEVIELLIEFPELKPIDKSYQSQKVSD
jgi:hypothetical protein